MRRLLTVFVSAFFLLAFPILAIGQSETPEPQPTPTLDPAVDSTEAPADSSAAPANPNPAEAPIPRVHVVAEGESLFYIAQLYGTTAESLQIANNLADPSLLYVGAELIVPGGEGEEVPTLYYVQVGDTAAEIAAKYNTSVEALAVVNHFVLPNSLTAGEPVSLMSRTGSNQPRPVTGTPYIVRPGDTLSSISIKTGVSLNDLRETNRLGDRPHLFPGQRLRLPSADFYRNLPHEWVTIELTPIFAAPGSTLSIYVENLQPGLATGSMTGPDGIATPLRFIQSGNRPGSEALIGIDAFAEPGEYLLSIGGEGVIRPWLPFEQRLRIAPSDYGFQQITISPALADLLAPEVRAEEDEFLETIFVDSNPEPVWSGLFQLPISSTVTAGYGASRSYNGGPFNVFHSGIDFSGGIGTPIRAPAAGTVVYSDTLTLRGSVLILDHGMGVMTAYYHLSKIDVPVGELVAPGQKIAEGGNTGLSTGPHLHWDVRVWGAAVDPTVWLQQSFP